MAVRHCPAADITEWKRVPFPTVADDDDDADVAEDNDGTDADDAEEDNDDDSDADADGNDAFRAVPSVEALCDASASLDKAALRCSKKSAGAHTIARTACRSTKVPP